MPTCYRLTFMCCQPCLLTFQCFQSCVSWTPFCYVRHTVVSETYPSVAVSHAWSKVLITVGWIWWRHQRGPILILPHPPPTLNPPLSLPSWILRTWSSGRCLSRTRAWCGRRCATTVPCWCLSRRATPAPEQTEENRLPLVSRKSWVTM